MNFSTWSLSNGGSVVLRQESGVTMVPFIDYLGWLLYKISVTYRWDSEVKTIFEAMVDRLVAHVPFSDDVNRRNGVQITKVKSITWDIADKLKSSLNKKPHGSLLGVAVGPTTITGGVLATGAALWHREKSRVDAAPGGAASATTENLRKASKPQFGSWATLLNNKHAEDVWMRHYCDDVIARVGAMAGGWAAPSTRTLYDMQNDPNRVEFLISDAPCIMLFTGVPWPPQPPAYVSALAGIPAGPIQRQQGCRNYFAALRHLVGQANVPILVYWIGAYDDYHANKLLYVDEDGALQLHRYPWIDRPLQSAAQMTSGLAAKFTAARFTPLLTTPIDTQVTARYNHYRLNPAQAL